MGALIDDIEVEGCAFPRFKLCGRVGLSDTDIFVNGGHDDITAVGIRCDSGVRLTLGRRCGVARILRVGFLRIIATCDGNRVFNTGFKFVDIDRLFDLELYGEGDGFSRVDVPYHPGVAGDGATAVVLDSGFRLKIFGVREFVEDEVWLCGGGIVHDLNVVFDSVTRFDVGDIGCQLFVHLHVGS